MTFLDDRKDEMSQPLRQTNGRAVSGRISGARGPLALLVLPLCCVTLLCPTVPQALAQDAKSFNASLVLRADQPKGRINRNLYGQFAEHLGRLIYDGIWVGEDSKIPNTRGIRNDVLAALKKLNIPVLRWPGGCVS